jgi:hypothetical protein
MQKSALLNFHGNVFSIDYSIDIACFEFKIQFIPYREHHVLHLERTTSPCSLQWKQIMFCLRYDLNLYLK